MQSLMNTPFIREMENEDHSTIENKNFYTGRFPTNAQHARQLILQEHAV
jgi:hypothetical protein